MIDEFGRNILQSVILAGVASAAKAGLLCLTTITPAIAISFYLLNFSSTVLRRCVELIADVMETIPILVWVIAIVVIVGNKQFLATLIVFSIASLPSAIRILLGEFDRITRIEYVIGARAIGASKLRLLLSYFLPESQALLMPTILSLFGGALTIDGALGILGMGNRMQLDLGTMVLRGKENFYQDPWLLIAALISFIFVYLLARAVVSFGFRFLTKH